MCVPLSPSASKSKPTGSTSDTPEKDKEKEKAASAAKSQENAPSTPTKTDKEKKEKLPKKKDKSSKGASNLPPVESKPPPGPLVALGRRDKPVKRPRSVERETFASLSLSHLLCLWCPSTPVCVSSASSVLYHHHTSELPLYFFLSVCVSLCSRGWTTPTSADIMYLESHAVHNCSSLSLASNE